MIIIILICQTSIWATIQYQRTVNRHTKRMYYRTPETDLLTSMKVQGDLMLMNHYFKPYAGNRFIVSDGFGLDVINEGELSDMLITKINQKPLNYPNPFKPEEGTTLAYSLNKSSDIEIYIYDMVGNTIHSESRIAGLPGAVSGLNNVFINPDIWAANPLSVGVYFYLILAEGEVLGRGKMGVIPDDNEIEN